MFPVHPRTAAAIRRHGLDHLIAGMDIRPAVPHDGFLALAQRAALLISDSGGVQEETTVLKKPLLVMRRSTERPEAIDAGFAQPVTPEDDMLSTARRMLSPTLAEHLAATPSPYGNGTASEKIVAAVLHLIDQ